MTGGIQPGPDAGASNAAASGSGSREKQKARSDKKERTDKKDAAAADKQKKRPLGNEKDVAKQGSSKVRPTHQILLIFFSTCVED